MFLPALRLFRLKEKVLLEIQEIQEIRGMLVQTVLVAEVVLEELDRPLK